MFFNMDHDLRYSAVDIFQIFCGPEADLGGQSLERGQKCDMAFFVPGRGHVKQGAGAFSARGHRALPPFLCSQWGPAYVQTGPAKNFTLHLLSDWYGTLRDNLQKFCNVLWDTTSMRMRRCSLT